jgi:hypothetical protein
LKRYIAIALILTIIFSTTEAPQLLKIPFLFKHFITHRQENPQLSFVGFLSMHYLHGSPKDKDYSDDMKLPFKTTSGNSVNFSIPAIIPPAFVFVPVERLQKQPVLIVYHRDNFVPSPHLSAVWQPPKCC